MSAGARPVRRGSALGAFAVSALALVALLVFLADNLPVVLGVWASILVGTVGAWYALTHRGARRGVAAGVAALAPISGVVLLVGAHALLGLVALVALVALAAGLGMPGGRARCRADGGSDLALSRLARLDRDRVRAPFGGARRAGSTARHSCSTRRCGS